jgi:hypothetical protein
VSSQYNNQPILFKGGENMQWKSIQGYDGYYEVSDSGLVRSLDRDVMDKKGISHHLSGKMMKLSKLKQRNNSDNAYLVVNLRKNGASYVAMVHRLVATAFIPNPNNYPTVNHKDGDKTNNSVDNLEWASYSENNIHAITHKLRQPRGNPILQKHDDGSIVKRYRSTYEASRETGISVVSISHCLNGRTNHAGGFIWEKLEDVTTNCTPEDELPVEVQRLQQQKI